MNETKETRQAAIPLQPVNDPANWKASTIENDPRVVFNWSEENLADFYLAVKYVEDNNIDLIGMTCEDFPIGNNTKTLLVKIKDQLVNGLGLQLIRGLPIKDYTRRQQMILFFGIGSYIGQALSQNKHGHIIGHVKDIGASKSDPNFRTYQTRDKLSFHSDSCDVTGLLCLQKAFKGGESLVTCSIAIYNEMLRLRPDLVEVMLQPFYVDRRGEVPPNKDPWYKLPIFNFKDGYLSVKGGRTYIDSAQRFPEVPRLTKAQIEALDMFESLAQELAFQMRFERGDIQLINNHVTVHSRNAYEDNPEKHQQRHLLRLWVKINNIRPLTEAYNERFNTGVLVSGTKYTVSLEPER